MRVLALLLLLASPVFAQEECPKSAPVRMKLTSPEECQRLMAIAPLATELDGDTCEVRLGKLNYRKAKQTFDYIPAGWIRARWRNNPEPTNSPRPSITPRPTWSPRPATPQPTQSPVDNSSLCRANPVKYCWAKGASLFGNECFANCECIERSMGACAN